MSLEASKIKCSSCGAYLFDEDDVVYCPVCGAPHHRDCYNALGHCAFEDKHGTDEQYDKSYAETTQSNEETKNDTTVIKKKCQMCGELYSADEFVCPNCKTPDIERFGRAGMTFDYLGGVPADMDLGEGVTADEAKQFVLANTHRFIPKFAAFKLGKKSSFNWLALFFPSGWFLSRKMYKAGILTSILNIALSMLIIPFEIAMDSALPENLSNYGQLINEMAKNIDTIGKPALITAAIAALLILVFKIICAVLGDFWYRNYCISTIKSIKTESEDIEEDFRKKGGVNIFLFIIGVLAVEYLPQIIFAFKF